MNPIIACCCRFAIVVLVLLQQERNYYHHHRDAGQRRRRGIRLVVHAVPTTITAFPTSTHSPVGVIHNNEATRTSSSIASTTRRRRRIRIQQRQQQLQRQQVHQPQQVLVHPILPRSTIVERRRRRERHLRLNDGGQKETSTATVNSTLPSPSAATSGGIITQNQLYQGYGTHFIDLYVGCGSSQKRQRQTLIVDTGSTVTGFPCGDCRDCGTYPDYHLDQAYDETQSNCFKRATNCKNANTNNNVRSSQSQSQSTQNQQKCLIGTSIYNQKRGEKSSYPKCLAGSTTTGTSSSNSFQSKQSSMCYVTKRYSEGSSWKAYEGIDQVSMSPSYSNSSNSNSSSTSFLLHFACQTSVTGLFKEQLADGIMGLKNGPGSFWKQMYGQVIDKQQFSLCFLSAEAAAISTTKKEEEKELAEMEAADAKAINKQKQQQQQDQEKQALLPEEVGVMMFGGVIDDDNNEADNNNNPIPPPLQPTPKFQYHTPMVYTEMTMSKTGSFQVHVEKIYLRVGEGGKGNEGVIIAGDDDVPATNIGKAVNIPEKDLNDGPFFIDSGATATYLSKNLEQPFKEAWEQSLKLMRNKFKEKSEAYDPERDHYKFTKEQISVLPTIIFEMKPWNRRRNNNRSTEQQQQQQQQRVLIALSPQNYMHYKANGGSYELYITFTVSTKRQSKQTLGANFIMGKQVVFDIDNLRIGFADSPKCDFVVDSTAANSTTFSNTASTTATAAAAANDDNKERQKVEEEKAEGQQEGKQPKQHNLPVNTNETTNSNNTISGSKSKEEIEVDEVPSTVWFFLGVCIVFLFGILIIVFFRRRNSRRKQRDDYTYSQVDYEDYDDEEEGGEGETDNNIFTSSDSRSLDGRSFDGSSQYSFDGSTDDELDEYYEGGTSTDDENFDTDDDSELQPPTPTLGGAKQLPVKLDRSSRGRRARRRRRRKRTTDV